MFLRMELQSALVKLQERFEAVRLLPIGPTHTFHLQKSQVQTHLDFLPSVIPGYFAYGDLVRLIRPLFQYGCYIHHLLSIYAERIGNATTISRRFLISSVSTTFIFSTIILPTCPYLTRLRKEKSPDSRTNGCRRTSCTIRWNCFLVCLIAVSDESSISMNHGTPLTG